MSSASKMFLMSLTPNHSASTWQLVNPRADSKVVWKSHSHSLVLIYDVIMKVKSVFVINPIMTMNVIQTKPSYQIAIV
jgi:hypothetical protein